MKKLIIPFAGLLLFAACKKTSPTIETASLEVEEKNMPVIAKRTATWCPPCGDWGFTTFASKEQQWEGKAVLMAWKDAFVESEGDLLFTELSNNFPVATPTFFTNFNSELGDADATAHIDAPVVANANYEMSVSGTQVNLKTTTKFFKNVEGEFFIAPYMIVDGIMGNQQVQGMGTQNLEHHKYVAKVAKPTTSNNKQYFGYKIANGKVDEGYTVSLDFEATRDLSWNENDISFGLIIFQKQADTLAFVNAFTK